MATNNALGIDIAGVTDVDLFLSYADRRRSAGESVMRVLFHAAGALWWAPDRGYHLAHLIHSFATPDQIESGVKAALEADERVDSAEVTAERLGNEVQVHVEVFLVNDPTAVRFTVSVDQANATISESP